jgi:ankyrin repeat protein
VCWACGPGLAAAASTPLIEAIKSRDPVAVNAALDRGADVNAAEGDGATALHWAAQIDDVEMLTLLLEAGAAVDATNRFNVTPLELAASMFRAKGKRRS